MRTLNAALVALFYVDEASDVQLARVSVKFPVFYRLLVPAPPLGELTPHAKPVVLIFSIHTDWLFRVVYTLHSSEPQLSLILPVLCILSFHRDHFVLDVGPLFQTADLKIVHEDFRTLLLAFGQLRRQDEMSPKFYLLLNFQVVRFLPSSLVQLCESLQTRVNLLSTVESQRWYLAQFSRHERVVAP
jgi:hypothetical protein